ncbi:MAG: hypothetical protein SGARI_002493 [Bacillariaceae sp.]
MLVVSWNPLIVYYHDGYLDIPYDEQDENEFLDHAGGTKVWRGSWQSMEPMLDSEKRKDVQDPVEHVRNQFKKALVKVGEGLALDVKERLEQLVDEKLPRYFGLYKAIFEVDRDMNVEIVTMHDDLWGSAFNLLEATNTTMDASKQKGEAMSMEALRQIPKKVQGGYHLIIYNSQVGKDDGPDWKFEYDWKEEAKECKIDLDEEEGWNDDEQN